MATELQPGSSSDDYPDPDTLALDFDPPTMAMAMEAAFLREWPVFNGDLPLPEAESKSLKAMRLLFIAVAQGVVQHLQANSAAFSVTVNQASHSHAGGDHTFDGDGSHTHDGGSHSHGAVVEIK
jgi:hypothetical protein